MLRLARAAAVCGLAVLAVVAGPVAVHAAPLAAPDAGGPHYVPSLAHAPDDHPSYYSAACQVTQGATTTHPCTFGDTQHPVLTVAMVGDSVAAEWLAAVHDIAVTEHWRIVTNFHSRCPWSATMTVNNGETVPYTACQTWGEAALRDLLRLHPDVVLTTDRPVLGIPGHLAADRTSFTAIGHGMATYWRTLLEAGIPVVPIRESPEMGFDVPSCLQQRTEAECSVPAATAITPAPPTVVAARESKGEVHLVDLNPVICPHGTCRPVAGRIVVYRDLHHLTATFVRSITPQVRRALLGTGVFSSGAAAVVGAGLVRVAVVYAR